MVVGTAPIPSGTSARNTGILVSFTAVTNLADGVLKIALPLLATRLTDSPGLVSAVAMALTLPWLLTALHVGVLVDRFDRRRLLWIADAVRVAVMAGLAAALAADSLALPLVYAGAVVLGVAEVVASTSVAAIVPSAVAPAGRERANAWVAGAETACGEFAGPFVGGLLVAFGASVALGATGLAFALAMAVLVLLVGRFAPAAGPPSSSVNARIAEGLRHLWQNRLLRGMALLMAVLTACWGAWLALMPLYATSVMGLDERGYGILLSALGAGGIAGALGVTWINRLLGQRWSMFADFLGTAAMVAAPALTANLWVVAGAAFLGGMGGTLWTVNARTIGQRVVSPGMLGRYSSAARLFGWGAMPLGAGAVGLLAEFAGTEAAFGVFGAAALLAVVPFLRVVTREALAAVPEHR
ncbi:MFS transporter [Nocardiopsis sp. NPDC058631]|uniref:MFS transporter n=1 Tax=Nocardiopsis sp. NPDC058631 TaxID=3346566 RepID=UPI00364EC560